MITFNINSKEYKCYVIDKIEEYNSNSKQTIILSVDVYFPYIDGVARVVHNYAEKLMKYYNVVVCCPSFKNEVSTGNYLTIACKSKFYKYVGYSLPLPNNDDFFKKCVSSLNKIKIIHIHSPFNIGRYFMKFAKKNNIKYIATFHSQYKKDLYKNIKLYFIANMVWYYLLKVFNNASLVTTMHDYSKNLLLSYGYKGEIKLIPNATDFKPLKNEDNTIVKKYDLKKEIHKLLFVGRLIADKKIFFLIDVCKILKEKGFNFRLYFVGDGPDKSKLIKKIKKYHLNEDIVLVGNLSNIKQIQTFYKNCNLLAFPSTYDVSSIVQIEAASQSLAGLFVDNSVTSCTIKDDHNGYLTKLDPNVYAHKIIEIFNDNKKLSKISTNAYKEIYITWDDIAKMVYELYKNI